MTSKVLTEATVEVEMAIRSACSSFRYHMTVARVKHGSAGASNIPMKKRSVNSPAALWVTAISKVVTDQPTPRMASSFPIGK